VSTVWYDRALGCVPPGVAQVVVPENPCGHGSPGSPSVAKAFEPFGCRLAAETLDTLRRGRQCQVAARPGIRATQDHQQIDVCRPRPDAFHGRQASLHLGVVECIEIRKIEPAIQDRLGESRRTRFFAG